ncbi:NADH:flavin oxidoreductase [Demetria terragena]|uniref:NADH:flavin oxidoreductase n=1 Tax=Demetria terragena TaxID=63959 RepID=UPI000382CBD9|nr:NADH:flavin oxidoreductase [Demetria terragena]
MATFDPLLEPYDLKGVRLRNRVVSTSHEPAYGDAGMPKERYRAYHVEKAKGGVGLTMMGGSAVVSPDSPPSFGNLLLWQDEIVPWLRDLVDEVHEHGAAVMTQITHLGRRTSNYTDDWLPLVYPSPLREPAHRAFPKAAERWDLDRITRDFADAAARCQAAGLDGIELEAYGHLLDGFLSPLTNHRTDEYGGDLQHRMAFPRQVIRAIREAVGPEFIVGIRMSMDEDRPGGLQPEETLEALRHYVSDGVDFLSLIKGTIDSDATLAKVIPSMGTPSAPFLEFAGQIKRAVEIPVMHASRISDVPTARHAIREGLLDLVGMTRAQLADPYLVAKVAARAEDRIRPCVGANYCLDAIYESGDAKCLHNPATGRELSLPQVVQISPGAKRRAVVVGAGPAGLEAARVLAERGHRVTVLEAADEPGGQVRLASQSPRRRDLIGITDWRVAEAQRAGATIKYGVYAETDDVLNEEPDLVIVATGGMPNREFLDGGTSLVSDSWDVLEGSVRPSGDVLVYDDNGTEPGLDAAEHLASAGARVHFVTPERTLGIGVGGMNAPAYLKAFAEHDVEVSLAYRLERVTQQDGRRVAHLRHEYANRTREVVVDRVVVEHGTLPNDELYTKLLPHSVNLGEVDHEALRAGTVQSIATNSASGYQLFRIGDAVASRNIHAAIYDALRLCHPF